ncbi:hypothetical protein DX933_14610 [Ornithinibacillus gellani]|uniref:hypothetical protein n=1 Tax=Ornithinibacillus gellani TaxID=2293253 RepID=UPI000F495C02|nr:hypothetical protein [Ornithinibacillus gellani]TQS72204.1 hypothetical protein DX933_14610 [Ornithinibacillus gellani]
MPAYLFVAAAALAVLPISFIYKISIEKIKDNPKKIGEIQNKFFIWVGLAEALPIILVVLGYANMAQAETLEELFLPGIIVLLLIGYAVFFIFLQRSIGVPKDAKEAIHTFSMVALMLSTSIPFIAIISLFLMMP